MHDHIRGVLWVLIPLAGFAFAAFDRYLKYRRQHDQLEVVKAYAAQGREPPAELVLALAPTASEREAEDWGEGRKRERGPMGDLRRAVFFAATAGGFAFGGYFLRAGEIYRPALIVAVIMGALAAGSALVGVLALAWKPK